MLSTEPCSCCCIIHIHIIVSLNNQLLLYCFCIHIIIGPLFVFVPTKETSVVAEFGVKVFLFNSLALEMQLLKMVAFSRWLMGPCWCVTMHSDRSICVCVCWLPHIRHFIRLGLGYETFSLTISRRICRMPLRICLYLILSHSTHVHLCQNLSVD